MKPGSRRDRIQSKDRTIWAPRDAAGNIINVDPLIGFDFICRHGHGVLGEVRMSTRADSDHTLLYRPMPGGYLPLEDGRPEGSEKMLLGCVECGTDTQVSAARVLAALNRRWVLNDNWVVACEL